MAEKRTILSLDQAAAQIGLSVETLRQWRKRGRGPRTFLLGRRVVIDQEDLTDWVNEQRLGTSPARSNAPVGVA